jgi:hypothetical protein
MVSRRRNWIINKKWPIKYSRRKSSKNLCIFRRKNNFIMFFNINLVSYSKFRLERAIYGIQISRHDLWSLQKIIQIEYIRCCKNECLRIIKLKPKSKIRSFAMYRIIT